MRDTCGATLALHHRPEALVSSSRWVRASGQGGGTHAGTHRKDARLWSLMTQTRGEDAEQLSTLHPSLGFPTPVGRSFQISAQRSADLVLGNGCVRSVVPFSLGEETFLKDGSTVHGGSRAFFLISLPLDARTRYLPP